MEAWLVAFGGFFTLLGVSLGFVLSQFAEARLRRQGADVAWDQLELELRLARVALDRTLEDGNARFAVDPPLDLPTLRTQYPLLVRASDRRVIEGVSIAWRYAEMSSLPVLRALWEHQRVASDEDDVPTTMTEAGVREATRSLEFLKRWHEALVYDRELRRRIHRFWPYSRTARDLRHALDQILEEVDLSAPPPGDPD